MKNGNKISQPFTYRTSTIGKTIIGTAFLLAANIYNGYSQTFTATKHDTVKRMASSQLWDMEKPKPENRSNVQKPIPLNSPTADNIIGDDKYLKTKEEGKRYDEFQVLEINGLTKDQVAIGMLTNTLDRGTRYDEKGALNNKIQVATGYLDELQSSNVVKPLHGSNGRVPVQAIHFHDKYFLIIGEHDFRYVDGKKLVGEKSVVDVLLKGKPITETTFFYELQNAGIVKNMTVTQFMKLDSSEKQRMLNSRAVAGNL